jgi:hypothetical protein
VVIAKDRFRLIDILSLHVQKAFGNTRDKAVVILLRDGGDEKYKIDPASKKEIYLKKSLFKKIGYSNLKKQSIPRIVIQNFLVEMGLLAKNQAISTENYKGIIKICKYSIELIDDNRYAKVNL